MVCPVGKLGSDPEHLYHILLHCDVLKHGAGHAFALGCLLKTRHCLLVAGRLFFFF